MAGAARSRVAGGLWEPNRQCPGRAGLGLFAARRRVNWLGADGRCGAAIVSVITARRMPQTRRTSALPHRAWTRQHTPRDAAPRSMGLVAVSYEGPVRETGAAWTRALAIADRLEDNEYQLRALWGCGLIE